MAAYRRVDDLVTCGLTACTPGSATGPTPGIEYGKPLSFLAHLCNVLLQWFSCTITTTLLELLDYHLELVA